jgi:hypothetical protein
MWMFNKSVRAASLVIVLAACTHRVDVALRPNFAAELKPGRELARVTPPLTFVRGEFTDKRPNPTQLATFKQQVHTYNLYEERPIADALYEGLRAAVAASNQMWSDSTAGDVKVNLTFINLQAARNSGMVSVGATSSIQIKADFVNASTGNLIYSNIYTGSDERSKAVVGLMGMVKDSIDASILRCVQSLVDDPGLAKALEGVRS